MGTPSSETPPCRQVIRSRLKRVLKIVSLALAGFVLCLWVKVLTSNGSDYVQIPLSGNLRGYVEGRLYPRLHLLLSSDRRGIVFDVFIPQFPPKAAPGPPWDSETRLWERPLLERSTAAYARHFGFEKGIEPRLGRPENDTTYFYGYDYYFAVPHAFLILVLALPALWPLRHILRRQGGATYDRKVAMKVLAIVIATIVSALVIAAALVLFGHNKTSVPLYVHFVFGDSASIKRLLSARIHLGEAIFVGGDDNRQLTGHIERWGPIFMADVMGSFGGQSTYYKGMVSLEKPFFGQGGAASGGVFPVWFAVSTNSDYKPILESVEKAQNQALEKIK